MSSDALSMFRPEDFIVHRFLNEGRTGSFLYDVSYKEKRYALKHVIASSQEDLRNTQRERDILIFIRDCKRKKCKKATFAGAGYRFLVSLYGAFQSSPVDLHQLMTLAEGGDLFEQRLLRPNNLFTEIEARFYLAELSCALIFLHVTCNVVHRDIKLENILLDKDGHILLADFNLAREMNCGMKSVSKEIGGTYQYLAPESVPPKCVSSYASDIYTVGMLALEMVIGACRQIPSGATEQQIFELIARGEREKCEERVSAEFARFVNCTCSTEPFCRPSISEVKKLPFFEASNHWAAINWDALVNRKTMPPPLLSNNESQAQLTEPPSVTWDSSEGKSYKGEILKNFHFEMRHAE